MAETYFTENKLDDLIGSLIGITQLEFNSIYDANKARMTEIEGTALRYAYKALNVSESNLASLFDEWADAYINLINEACTESEMDFITYVDSCFHSNISYLAAA